MATRNERKRKAKAKRNTLLRAVSDAFQAEERRKITKRNLGQSFPPRSPVKSSAASWPLGYSAHGANGTQTRVFHAKIVKGKLSGVSVDTYARPKRKGPGDWPVVNRDAIVEEYERAVADVKAWQQHKA